jgi:hypothetical protein
MSDLRDRLDAYARDFVPAPDARARVIRRAHRRRVVRRVTAGAAAAAITAGVIVGLWGLDRPSPSPVDTPTPPPHPTAFPNDGLRMGAEIETNGWVVLADGWGVHVAGAGTLAHVDPVTGRVGPTLDGQGWDYDFTTMARYGEGSLWLASGQTLWHIGGSPDYAVGDRLDLGSLGYLGDILQTSPAAGGEMWVAANPGESARPSTLAEIDPDTGTVLRAIEDAQGVDAITEAGGYVVASARDGLVRVDPRTGTTDAVPLVRQPEDLEGVGGTVWWTSGAGTVTCVDVRTLEDCGTVQIPRATSLAADGGNLWVLSSTGSSAATVYEPDPEQPATITLMDGTTGRVLAGPLALTDTTPATLSAFDGHAWIGFHDTGQVVRIDRCAFDRCEPTVDLAAVARLRLRRDTLMERFREAQARLVAASQTIAALEATPDAPPEKIAAAEQGLHVAVTEMDVVQSALELANGEWHKLLRQVDRPIVATIEPFAVWPEDDALLAALAPDDEWRRDAVQVALAFAHDVAGWSAPVAREIADDDPWSATIVVSGTGPDISLTLEQPLPWRDGRWWVTHAEAGLRGTPQVAIDRGGTVRVTPTSRFATIEVAFGSGGLEISTTLAAHQGGPYALRADFENAYPGHVLYLTRDGDGRLLELFARTTPAGDVG